MFILLFLVCLVYIGVRISIHAPAVITGPDISLSFWALPWYTLLSVGRMFAAYLLSLAFTLVYGYIAARNRTAEKMRAWLFCAVGCRNQAPKAIISAS